jgi:hypothetical protein
MGRNLTNLNINATYEGLVQISGSQLTDGTGSLIPSLEITASDATSAVSSSYAVSASQSDSAISSSYAVSASHATFAETAGGATDVNALYTASVVDANIAFIKGGGSTFDIEVNNVSSSISASYAVNADTATSASHAVNADTSISSSYALTASFAENAGTPNLQQVLDEGSTATGSIELYDVGFNESVLLTFNSNGGSVLSGRTNSILELGVDQGGQTDLITLGAQGAIGFYGLNSGNNFNNNYNWGSTKGWISGSLAVQQAFTASGLIYPATDGTTGQVIGTDGAGNLSFITAGGGGGGTAGLISGSASNSLLSANYTTTDALAEGNGSISIGDNSQVTGSTSENTIVIGKDADSKENSIRNVIVGYNARMTEANRNDSVIIGANANGYQEGVAIGADAFTIYQAVSVGKGAYTNDNYAVAIGAGARANNTAGIAVGSGSLSDGNNSIAIGQGAHATAEGDVVLYNGVSNVYEYDKSATTTTLQGQLNINAVSSAYAISASLGSTEEFKVDYHSNGARVLSSRANSVLHLGTPSITNAVSIGRNNAIGFFGDGFEPSTNYNFASNAGNIKVPFTFEDLTISGSVTNEVDVISDLGGITTMDCSASNFFTLAMPSGGTTTLTPSNIQAGQTISVKITQNATPSTLTFAPDIEFEGGTAFTISTGAGEVDVMTFISFDGTTLQATGLKNFS